MHRPKHSRADAARARGQRFCSNRLRPASACFGYQRWCTNGLMSSPIDVVDLFHDARRNRRQRGGFGVRARLRRVARAGNDHAHRVEHQDPAQRELCHRGVARHQRPYPLDRREAPFIGHAGKRLADIEGFAVAVELAVVGVFELGVALELARQQAAGQRHARDDGDLLLLGQVEEQVGRALAERVEDDLDADDAGIFHRLQRLFDALDADAVIADLAAARPAGRAARTPRDDSRDRSAGSAAGRGRACRSRGISGCGRSSCRGSPACSPRRSVPAGAFRPWWR